MDTLTKKDRYTRKDKHIKKGKHPKKDSQTIIDIAKYEYIAA